MDNRTTEKDSLYRHLEKKSTIELLNDINTEDQKVALVVQKCIPIISKVVEAVHEKMKEGGRLFYIGAGTSGRLGILDASECPPTFGVPHDWVVGIIAGGDKAIRKAVENAEDSQTLAWEDLKSYNIDSNDFVIGIAASGTTPYVIHGVNKCKQNGITTACITCNLGSPLAAVTDFAIEVLVGPEYITGSTRMKSGTAQKLVLNMISTSVMIKLGRVVDNKMVDMQLSNEKLRQRAVRMVIEATQVEKNKAEELLNIYGSVRAAIEAIK